LSLGKFNNSTNPTIDYYNQSTAVLGIKNLPTCNPAPAFARRAFVVAEPEQE